MLAHEEQSSELLRKGLPCPLPDCDSSDAFAEYSDGHGYCFSCHKPWFPANSGTPPRTPTRVAAVTVDSQKLLDVLKTGTPKGLPDRKLTQATCRKWGYLYRDTGAGWQHLAAYRDKDGTLLDVKLRDADKKFPWIGHGTDGFFGRNLWGSSGKMVVVTEGEIDAMTVSQVQDHQYPTVSLPGGTASVTKSFARNLPWLCSFGKVIIAFDMDAPGREACRVAASMLPAGKAWIVKWTEKDANAMLMAGKAAEITRCIWNAEAYRPDGILDARDVNWDPPHMGIPWPWKCMTDWTLGRRGGELYTFGAGTGLGKSDMLAEVVASTLTGEVRETGEEYTPEGFAIFGYESGPGATKLQIAGKIARRRFQFPQGHPNCLWTEAELEAVKDRMNQSIWGLGGKLFLLDSKGAADWGRVKDHCRFLRAAEGVLHFLVDPIGALVIDEDDERKFLDKATLEGAALAVELGAKVYFVSHLSRPKDGPHHEEGGHVRLGQFRGSNGVGMYSHFVFGLERNQQAETEAERTTTTMRAVKDRLTGNSTGETFALHYDRLSGTLDPEQGPVEDHDGISEEDKALL